MQSENFLAQVLEHTASTNATSFDKASACRSQVKHGESPTYQTLHSPTF